MLFFQIETEKTAAIENGKTSHTPEPVLELSKDSKTETVLKGESEERKVEIEKFEQMHKESSEGRETIEEKILGYQFLDKREPVIEKTELNTVETRKIADEELSVHDIEITADSAQRLTERLEFTAEEEKFSIDHQEDTESIVVVNSSSVELEVIDNKALDNKTIEECGEKTEKQKIKREESEKSEKEQESVKIEDVARENNADILKKGESSKNEEDSKSDEEEKKDEDKKEASDEENCYSTTVSSSEVTQELEPERRTDMQMDESNESSGGSNKVLEKEEVDRGCTTEVDETIFKQEESRDEVKESIEEMENNEEKESDEKSEDDKKETQMEKGSGFVDVTIPPPPPQEMIATISGSLHEKDRCEKEREAKAVDEEETQVSDTISNISVKKEDDHDCRDSQMQSTVGEVPNLSLSEGSSQSEEVTKVDTSIALENLETERVSSCIEEPSLGTVNDALVNETPVSNVSVSDVSAIDVSVSDSLVTQSIQVCDNVQTIATSASFPPASSPVSSAVQTPEKDSLTKSTSQSLPEDTPEQTSIEVQVSNKEVQESSVNEVQSTPKTEGKSSTSKEVSCFTALEAQGSPMKVVPSSSNVDIEDSQKNETPVFSGTEQVIENQEHSNPLQNIGLEAPVTMASITDVVGEEVSLPKEILVSSSRDKPKDQESQTEETGDEHLSRMETNDSTELKVEGALMCGQDVDKDEDNILDVEETVKISDGIDLTKDQVDLGLRRHGISLTSHSTLEKEKDRHSE